VVVREAAVRVAAVRVEVVAEPAEGEAGDPAEGEAGDPAEELGEVRAAVVEKAAGKRCVRVCGRPQLRRASPSM